MARPTPYDIAFGPSAEEPFARIRASLAASRKGDYMRIARLTAMAASLNRSIIETEGLISPDLF